MAAINLWLAIPLQATACGMYIVYNFTLCSAVDVCQVTKQQYHRLHSVLGKAAATLPFSLPDNLTSPIDGNCLTILINIEITMLLIFSFYLSFAVEISSRLA